MTETLPPHDLNSEMCLLASLVVCDRSQEVWSTVTAACRPGTFHLKDHGVIYEVLCWLWSNGKDIDGVIVREELARRNQLEGIGGLPYLAQILNAIPSWAHWRTYLANVVDTHQRRQLLKLSEALAAKAHLPATDSRAVDIAAESQKYLASIVESGTGGRYERIDAIAGEVWDDFDNGVVNYVPTGFKALDEKVGGFGEGEFWLLGARPSMGKSTLIRQMGVRIARSGIPVGFISLEEGRKKIGRNILSMESGIDNHKIRHHSLCQEEFTEVANGLGRIKGLPLFVSTNARRLNDIASVAAVMQAREGIQILIIDYLQKIGGTHSYERYEAVTEISLAISDLAKTLNLAILCPVQLNRQVTGRDDKRPTMADIRESGQIEQDADGIIFLHREDYYRTHKDGVAELIIAKQRDGIRGITVRLKSELNYQRFVDMDYDVPPEAA